MANHADALKRMRQNAKRRMRNRHYRATMRTQIKKVRVAIEAGDAETAAANLNGAVSIIQRLATKGIIHRNQASRRVARLYKAVNKLKASNA
ncbi:MAG: 30S ribosomal protein S20 [Myxococcota bacterium]|nr:30S ribosomal protein S20 [Myxococcota bacterium]